MPGTMTQKPGQEFRRGLGHRVVERVAAADVGLQRMLRPHAITQLDVVVVARAAAVGAVGTRRQKGTVDAVLHVKHGDLLMDYHFQPVRRNRVQKIGKLADIEVVGSRHPRGASVLEQLNGKRVGRVEREVGDEGNSSLGAEVKAPRVADEDAIGTELGQVSKQVGLTGLLDAGRGQVDRRTTAPGGGDGAGVFLDVLIIGVDGADAERDGCLDL